MPRVIKAYVRYVEAVNYRVGRMAMYLIFVLMAVLLISSSSKILFVLSEDTSWLTNYAVTRWFNVWLAGYEIRPTQWTFEIAQFLMVAYYLLGGPYSMQLNSHVRMDLLYGSWSDKTKAWVDAFTVFGLIFYLSVLLWGGLGSTAYSLGYFGSDYLGFFKDLFVGFVTGGISGATEVTGYKEVSATAMHFYLSPIKSIACLGIFLMILQGIAVFFKDIATIRGVEM